MTQPLSQGEETVVFPVSMTATMRKRLRDLAGERDQSAAEIVRRALWRAHADVFAGPETWEETDDG